MAVSKIDKMLNVFISDIAVVTPARVEITLFIPDMSVRELLSSCHDVYASYEVAEELGWSRYKELLNVWLAKNPNIRRRLLVARAIQNGVRPRLLRWRHRPSFWASVVARDRVAERERYEKTVIRGRYNRVIRELETLIDSIDDTESSASDSSVAWSSDWSDDVLDYVAARFPYEKYFDVEK